MIRRLFTAASVCSFLLCLSTCALWVRSYTTGDEYQWMDRADGNENDHANQVKIGDGRVALLRFRCTWMGRGLWHLHPITSHVTDPADFPVARHAVGFYWLDLPRKKLHGVLLPGWALIVATAAAPVWQVMRWRSRSTSHAPNGCCPTCGYDLRASKDRCPECWTPITSMGTNA